MSLYQKVIDFVDTAFNRRQKEHFERTVYWYEQFLPDITDIHRIAAYAHDIERAFKSEEQKIPSDYQDPEFLKYHQEKGAEIIAEFLQKEGGSEADIEKVKHLVSKHEVGGDAEQDLLKDADSVSFFETNAEMFVIKKAPVEGYQKIREKLDWMFNRITSENAREAARSNYKRWIKELRKYV